MMRRIAATTGLALVLLTATAVATVEPRVGEPMPYFEARDLLGGRRNSRELVGRPTLVAVITDRNGPGVMLPWLNRATARYPGGRVHLVLLLALDLPVYAGTGTAIRVAREAVPRAYWGDTWLDRSGTVQRAFGLPEHTRAPFVFVLDARGGVRAVVRGQPTERDALKIWSALPTP
jgi:predicted transcriptional regulator